MDEPVLLIAGSARVPATTMQRHLTFLDLTFLGLVRAPTSPLTSLRACTQHLRHTHFVSRAYHPSPGEHCRCWHIRRHRLHREGHRGAWDRYALTALGRPPHRRSRRPFADINTTVIAYGIAGVAALSSGLSFAQLGKYVHTSGGALEYSEIVFGELVGWLVGWSTVLEITLSSSAVSRGMRGYLLGGGSSLGYALKVTSRILGRVGRRDWRDSATLR